MALIKGPYSVVDNLTWHDPLTYRKVTGTFDFPDEHTPPKEKWWVAVKGSQNAHGSILVDPGTITGITLTAGGSGYVAAPNVNLTGGGGTGATATATISNGAVSAIALTSAGTAYTSSPTITFSVGSGAAATSTVANGAVTGVTVTAGGTLYVAAPNVTFTGGGGTGAAGTVALSNGSVSSVTITSGGSGYTSAPTVAFTTVGSGATATVAFTLGTVHIDTSKAQALPGVHGVYTFANNASLVSSWTNYGAPIAAVCADDWETAEYACTLINVTYVTLPVVYDADAAALPTSPLSGKVANSNITTSTFTRGDVTSATGFAAADQTITVNTGWYRTMQHNPVQPKTALCWESGGEWFGYCCMQNPIVTNTTLASGLTGVSIRNIHEQKHTVGGGFGDGESPNQLIMAGRISQALNGHPIVVKLDRNGHNHIGSRQYDTNAQLKIGAKNDGTLVAMSGNWNGNGGGASGMWYGIDKTYKCPNISWTATNINTNTPGRGAWRCVSDEPGGEAYEIALDKVAAALKMDPYALRMKNIMAVTDPDQDSPYYVWSDKGVNSCMAQVYQQSGYATKMHAPGQGPAQANGWLHGIAIVGHQDAHGGVSGSGRYGHLILGVDGICKLYHGGATASTGPQGAMMQITAEVMGLAYSDVDLVAWADCDLTYTAGMQNGSGHTGGAGTAYYNAALNLRNIAFKRATTIAPFSTITPANVTTKATATATIANGAVTSITVTNGGAGYSAAPTVIISGGTSDVANGTALAVANINSSGTVTSITVTNGGSLYTAAPTVTIYSVTTADLDAANSSIFLKSDPTKTLTYAQVCSGWIAQPSIATGWGGNLRWGAVGASQIGAACNTTGSSAACAEVLVDPETGDVHVTGYWNATATGTTINAVAVQKEIGSGCEAAIGQALFYGDVYDPNTAAVLQVAHGSFQHLTSLDFDPTTFHLYDVQNFDMCGPLGAHGMAEPGSTNAPAIQCAIFNATAGTTLNPNGTLLNPKHGACSQDIILASLGLA